MSLVRYKYSLTVAALPAVLPSGTGPFLFVLQDARLSHNVDGIVAKMQLVERQLQQNQKVVGLIRCKN